MSAATSISASGLQPEGRVRLVDIRWDHYVAMSDMLGPRAKLTYLDGALEIMTTSRDHEALRILLCRLLDTWAFERKIELEGYGGMTFRERAEERGLEADACYTIGVMGTRPDIAIEIVISSPLLNKLDVYAGLDVPEVWVFEDGALTIHRLVDGAYERRTTSEVLPTLDVGQLVSFIRLDATQTAQVRAYHDALRG